MNQTDGTINSALEPRSCAELEVGTNGIVFFLMPAGIDRTT